MTGKVSNGSQQEDKGLPPKWDSVQSL